MLNQVLPGLHGERGYVEKHDKDFEVNTIVSVLLVGRGRSVATHLSSLHRAGVTQIMDDPRVPCWKNPFDRFKECDVMLGVAIAELIAQGKKEPLPRLDVEMAQQICDLWDQVNVHEPCLESNPQCTPVV